jgi:hypothetical protein
MFGFSANEMGLLSRRLEGRILTLLLGCVAGVIGIFGPSAVRGPCIFISGYFKPKLLPLKLSVEIA